MLLATALCLMLCLLWACGGKPSPERPDPNSPLTRQVDDAANVVMQDPTRARTLARQALALPEAETDLKGAARALRVVGVASTELGQFDTALTALDSSRALCLAAGDQPGLAASLNNIGIVYDYQGYYALALRYYQDALRIREALGDSKEIAKGVNNIGTVYYSLGRYAEALESFRRSYHLARASGHDQGTSLLNMGSVFLNLGPADSALYYMQKAESWNLEAADSLSLVIVRANLARVYHDLGRNTEAIALAEQTLQQAHKLGRHKSILVLMNHLGLFYAKGGQTRRGLDTLQRALQMLNMTTDREEYYEIIDHLRQAYRLAGQYPQALEAAQVYIDLQDSMQRVGNDRAVAELRILYETEQQQHHIAQLELQNRADRLRLWGAVLLAAVGLLAAVLIVNRQRALLRREKELAESRRKLLEQSAALLAAEQANAQLAQQRADAERRQADAERERLNAELAFKNREITNLALQIGVKNDLLHDLQDALRDFQPPRPAERERVQSLLQDLNQRLHLDQDVAQVDQHVEQVQEGFLHRLEQLCPGLTKAERRLASYIRMELSSKEIAGLLNIAPRSVDVARHRLRKKLNLPEDANLTDYIRSI